MLIMIAVLYYLIKKYVNIILNNRCIFLTVFTFYLIKIIRSLDYIF